MSLRVASFLVGASLLASASSAWACGYREIDMGHGHPAIPLAFSNSETGEKGLIWKLFGHLPAQGAGFIRLRPSETGDRWEAISEGEDELAKWRFTPTGNDQKRDGGLVLRVSAKKEGATNIPLRYVPASGAPQDLHFRLYVSPPPSPPEPQTLRVEGETFRGRVDNHSTFLIHLKKPLAPGHRWEVKEAVYQEWDTSNGDKWLPIDVSRRQGEEGHFMTSAQGQSARIVFVQKGSDGQYSAETVTLLLDVTPTAMC